MTAIEKLEKRVLELERTMNEVLKIVSHLQRIEIERLKKEKNIR